MKKAYLAEMIGTMFLVLVGCGAAVLVGQAITGSLGIVLVNLFGGNTQASILGGAFAVFGNLSVALSFGLILVAMIYTLGPISGGHFNPAVTTAMLICRNMNKKDALFYILFQIIGAIIGAFILWLIVSNIFTLQINSLGQNVYNSGLVAVSFIIEMVFTALFVFVVLGTTSSKANIKFAGLAIGLTLAVIHIVCIPITGTSVNPARSIGPAIFMGWGAISQLWLFILAPIVGAVLGAFGWKLLSSEEKSA